MSYPFEVPYAQIQAYPEPFIDTVFGVLQSSFLLLPRGPGFITYLEFEQAYEVLKRHTAGFDDVESENILRALQESTLALIVLRTILGFTPSELAYVATEKSEQTISQSFARSLDRRIRIERQTWQSLSERDKKRIAALVRATCELLHKGISGTSPDMLHRLDKADTRSGLDSLRHVSMEGVPYAMLLYERFLGRPFATHRDSVSELVGNVMEDAVEQQLRGARISYRRTGRAERLEGFDQAPDFVIPDEWSPHIVIEAKITEDDGTARDKVTRIQHLAEIDRQQRQEGKPGFQIIACIDGRGFGVRREDMRKLLEATKGKVFTLSTLDQLVENTDLDTFKPLRHS